MLCTPIVVVAGTLLLLLCDVQTFNLKGAASIEKGGKNQREHIQAVMELTIPTDKVSEGRFKQHYKEFVQIDSSDRAKLTFKPLGESQTFMHMLGYVQKDLGKPHYRIVTHDVTTTELNEARKCYADVSGDYKAGKIVISKAGMAERMWAFWNANYKPFIVPQDVILLHMIQSEKYVPCGTWVSAPHGRSVDFEMSASWMLMVCRPGAVKMEHIRILFWGEHSRTRWRDTRYFKPTIPDFSSSLTELQRAAVDIWYDHCYDTDIMAQVVHDLRACLQQLNIPFSKYNAVDEAFLHGFEMAYTSAAAPGALRTAALFPPQNEHYSEDLGDAAEDERDATAIMHEDDDDLLRGLLADSE